MIKFRQGDEDHPFVMIVPGPFAGFYAGQEPCDLAEIGERWQTFGYGIATPYVQSFWLHMNQIILILVISFVINGSVRMNKMCVGINVSIDVSSFSQQGKRLERQNHFSSSGAEGSRWTSKTMEEVVVWQNGMLGVLPDVDCYGFDKYYWKH